MRLKESIAVLMLLYSCSQESEHLPIAQARLNKTTPVLSVTYDTLLTNDSLEKVVRLFLKENPCDTCIHEMYVHKVNSTKIIITLRARVGSTEYLQEKNPLFALSFNSVSFYLYTGLEDLLTGDGKKIKLSEAQKKGTAFCSWSIFINSGKYEIDRTQSGKPFFEASPPMIELKDK